MPITNPLMNKDITKLIAKDYLYSKELVNLTLVSKKHSEWVDALNKKELLYCIEMLEKQNNKCRRNRRIVDTVAPRINLNNSHRLMLGCWVLANFKSIQRLRDPYLANCIYTPSGLSCHSFDGAMAIFALLNILLNIYILATNYNELIAYRLINSSTLMRPLSWMTKTTSDGTYTTLPESLKRMIVKVNDKFNLGLFSDSSTNITITDIHKKLLDFLANSNVSKEKPKMSIT